VAAVRISKGLKSEVDCMAVILSWCRVFKPVHYNSLLSIGRLQVVKTVSSLRKAYRKK